MRTNASSPSDGPRWWEIGSRYTDSNTAGCCKWLRTKDIPPSGRTYYKRSTLTTRAQRATRLPCICAEVRFEMSAIALAREIAHETAASDVKALPAPGGCARQGDVVLVSRPAEASASVGGTTAERVIAEGRHGSHVLLPDGPYTVVRAEEGEDGALLLSKGGVIVHTDTPSGRHGAVRVPPGRLGWWLQRELDLDGVVREVVD